MATNTEQTLDVVITSVTRRKNSVNGNPRYVLHTNLGDYATRPDASVGYDVSTMWEDVPAQLTVNGRRQVIGVIARNLPGTVRTARQSTRGVFDGLPGSQAICTRFMPATGRIAVTSWLGRQYVNCSELPNDIREMHRAAAERAWETWRQQDMLNRAALRIIAGALLPDSNQDAYMFVIGY